MPTDIERSAAPIKGAISAGGTMKTDLKEKLLSTFELLDDQKKSHALEYIKKLVSISNASASQSRTDSGKGPWTDIVPLRLDGISLSDVILADRAESDE